jgi:hypothetical protein
VTPRACWLAATCALASGCAANDDVPPPAISAITPDHASPGAVVAITGAYFCQRPPRVGNEDPACTTTGVVYFGASPGAPTTWSDNAIMVEVPGGVTCAVAVAVTAAGRTSNQVSFTAP